MLSASLETIQSAPACSFLVRQFEEEAFSAPYHFHPEYELTLITKGTGKRYIGNHLDYYAANDLVLIGPHLPHCWKTEPVIKNKKTAGSIVVQFPEDFLGAGLFLTPECQPIKKLLYKSSGGLLFGDSAKLQAIPLLYQLEKEPDLFTRLLLLLQVLHLLAKDDSHQVLNLDYTINQQPRTEQERIHLVLSYIVDHYREEISLQNVATIACMTPTAFCKYFKKMTRKTFVEFLLDYRINYATAMLLNTDKSVSAVCFESGFNDLSYFSRSFKSKLHDSPHQYRKLFKSGL